MRPAKSTINLKSTAKYEKSVGKAHKAMRRMGCQSKEEAQTSITKGYIFNAPVNARDFALHLLHTLLRDPHMAIFRQRWLRPI